MPIDPSSLEAIKTVRTRTEFEQFTETFPEGTMAEIQTFVGAARHLADDVQRLNAVILSMPMRFETLDQANDVLCRLGNGVNPVIEQPMPDWPHDCTNDTAELLVMTLAFRVLPVIASHAATLTTALRAGGYTEDISHLVAEMYRRVLDRPHGSQERKRWACWLHDGIRDLVAVLGKALYQSRHAAKDITAEEFRITAIGTGPQSWQQPLRHAITMLHALASKALPDGRTINWWPLHADENQAVHVGQVLEQLLAVIEPHADALSAHGGRIHGGTNLPAFLEQMRGRITHMQVVAAWPGRIAATEFVQSGIHVLVAHLPASDSPVVTELDKTTSNA